MEKQPISTRFHASSSLAGGTRFGGVAQWQSSGLLDQRAQVRPLPPPQISSFRRGGFHARFYESRCPGSTPGGRTTSPSSSWPRTPASHVGNAGFESPRGRHCLAASAFSRPRPAGCRRSPPKRDALGSTPCEGARSRRHDVFRGHGSTAEYEGANLAIRVRLPVAALRGGVEANSLGS